MDNNSRDFSSAELRSILLAVEVLRGLRKDEVESLTLWVPESPNPIIKKFKYDRQTAYQQADGHLAGIQTKLEDLLSLADKRADQANENIGRKRPEEHAAVLGSI